MPKTTWVLNDLILLVDAGVKIDREVFDEALEYENSNYSLIECPEQNCHAPVFGQHTPVCAKGSILWEPDWHRRIAEDDYPVKRGKP
jgi:hypothetical protein